jgi:hypothetical protein
LSKKPNTASRKEVAEIKELSNSYSYSAFLKILIARIENSLDLKGKNKKITTAAIYTSNRTNLKSLLTKDSKKPASSPGKKEKKSEVLKDDKKGEASPATVQKIEKKEVTAKKKATHSPKTDESDNKVIQKHKLSIPEANKGKIKDTSGSKEKNKKETKPSTKSSKPEEIKEDIKLEKGSSKEEVTDFAKVKSEQSIKKPFKENNKETTDSKEELIKKSDSENLYKEQTKNIPEAPLSDVSKEINKDDSEPDESTRTAKDNLIQEVLNNINVLKKNKAILLNLLSDDNDKKSKPTKKKPDPYTDKEKISEKSIEEQQPGNTIIKKNVAAEEKYQSYEEEDPEVIKGFLDKLEENNPPPKRKLKKKEQVELIERFISSDHRIKNIKPAQEVHKKEDLSLHSVKFRDDIISENLANIMIKQGKLEKAIDIYKKLIWKFPQKKTYFATQIEELKKKSGN